MTGSADGATVLVTGSQGQIGWELIRHAGHFDMTVIGTDRTNLDITQADEVERSLHDLRPRVVINAAAYTAVDKAESEAASAFAVNQDGPAYLARACAQARIPLIHLSTDYVFDGTKLGAYLEEDPVHPLNVYGVSKEAGEQKVRQFLQQHLILRTSWVYGVHGNNFIKTILRLAQERDVLRIVADQWGCPTAAGDMAEAALQLVAKMLSGQAIPWGTYHCAGDGETNWCQFAEEAMTYASPFWKKKAEVIPITTADYPTAARRPLNSVLDCTKLENTFGIRLRPWQLALKEMVNESMGHSPQS